MTTPEVTVLAVGGTGESFAEDDRSQVTGLLAAVTDLLDERFAARWVPYPASYGPVPRLRGLSVQESVARGECNLRRAISRTSGPVMLIGYSQGAVVVRNILAQTAGTVLGRRIVAAGFVADPWQPPGKVEGCDGYGIAGVGPDLPPGLPVLWIADPRDMICNASVDSFLRDVADLTAAMSLTRRAAWLRSVWGLLRANTLQNAGRTRIHPTQWLRDVRRLVTAIGELLGYLPALITWHGMRVVNRRGGAHTCYTHQPLPHSQLTGCEALAGWLQVQHTFARAVLVPAAA